MELGTLKNHSVMDDIPPENYRVVLDAGLEFGVY
jgi:hypothetical protein